LIQSKKRSLGSTPVTGLCRDEVAAATQAGVAGRASRPAVRRTENPRVTRIFDASGVFREGAENCARGGRAPITASVLGAIRLNKTAPAGRSLRETLNFLKTDPKAISHRFRR
jgi:hypothetical protein